MDSFDPRPSRQGDVGLKPLKGKPEALKGFTKEPIRGTSYQLKEGEGTGHYHVLEAEAIEVYKVSPVEVYLKVTGAARVVHPEHDHFDVRTGQIVTGEPQEAAAGTTAEPAWFRFINQRQFDAKKDVVFIRD